MLQADDVGEIDQDESISVLDECGLNYTLTNDNKMLVTQALVIHDVIGRRKVAPDQLSDGLKALDFLNAMQSYPKLFEELFVLKDHLVSRDVIKTLKFDSNLKEEGTKTKNYFLNFIENSGKLGDILIFITGSPVLPGFGLGKIRVCIESSISILSIVCTNTITLPDNFQDQDTFNAALEAVMVDEKKFNCI